MRFFPYGVRALAAAAVLFLVLSWPAFGGEHSPAGTVDLYQVSTIEALSAGLYTGEMRLSDVARHGDFGLGTLVDLDGEMVLLDGVFYQAKSDGTVRVVPTTETTPFADVVFFKGNLDLGRVDGLNLDGLKAALTAKLPDPTHYYAARLDGTFTSLTARSVAAQAQPWPPLATAVAGQSVFSVQGYPGHHRGHLRAALGPRTDPFRLAFPFHQYRPHPWRPRPGCHRRPGHGPGRCRGPADRGFS